MKSLEGSKPRVMSATSVPAGTYSLFIANDGPHDEQVALEGHARLDVRVGPRHGRPADALAAAVGGARLASSRRANRSGAPDQITKSPASAFERTVISGGRSATREPDGTLVVTNTEPPTTLSAPRTVSPPRTVAFA